MAKKTEEVSKEQKLVNKIADYVVSHKYFLILCLILIVVAVVALVVTTTVTNSNREKAQIRVEALETRYNEYVTDLDSEKYSALVTDLNAEIKGSAYPSVKASYLLGLVEFETGNFDAAYDAFYKAYELNKNIYLAPFALVNAAACKENLSDSKSAMDLYNLVASEYPESGVAPKALFGIARIYLADNNVALAKATFNQLADNYPASEYAKMAQNKLNTL